ncbi:MAG TPA: YkvA family protein [Syntrophorhabdaceae bacterium]|nr:YkvA family protein [Syntrophorhabdaceae bacterium]
MNFDAWKNKAKNLKRDLYALSLAIKEPGVPWYARVFAVVIIGYALSPVDLIPDFIPVLGYVDDIVILPAAILLLIKMIPPDVMEECRQMANAQSPGESKHWAAAIIIILLWLTAIYLLMHMIFRDR